MDNSTTVRICICFNMYEHLNVEERYSSQQCKKCGMEKNICVCASKFPPLKEFKKGGLFEDIKLPIAETEEIPDELFNYIFPASSYDNSTLDLIKSNTKIIEMLKFELNFKTKYLKYDRFPELEDFKEGGIFSHITLRSENFSNIHDEILEYIFGKNFDKTSLSYVEKMGICDRLCHYADALFVTLQGDSLWKLLKFD